MDIVEFLLARIREDESKSQELLARPFLSESDRWYEQRMLTECAAKRVLVDVIGHAREAALNHMILSDDRESRRLAESIEWTVYALSALALPYMEHPDYQDSWRLPEAR